MLRSHTIFPSHLSRFDVHSFSLPMKCFTSFSTYSGALSGWRGSLKILCALSWFMLSVNIFVSVALTVMSKHQKQHAHRASDSVVMMHDTCKQVNRADTVVHLFMNIFSAVLLGATVGDCLPVHPNIVRRLSHADILHYRTLPCKHGQPQHVLTLIGFTKAEAPLISAFSL